MIKMETQGFLQAGDTCIVHCRFMEPIHNHGEQGVSKTDAIVLPLVVTNKAITAHEFQLILVWLIGWKYQRPQRGGSLEPSGGYTS